MKIQHLRNGVILISVGLVFLFNNLGYVEWEVWETILSWWPVYLIALGIEIVFRNSTLKPLALISPIAFTFFILGPAWWQWESKEEDRLVQKVEWSQPLSKQINSLQANLEFRLGSLTIENSDNRTVNCVLEYQSREPYVDFTETEGRAKFTLIDRSKKHWGIRFNEAGVVESNWGGPKDKDWKIAIDTTTPLELALNSQLTKNELDLTRIKTGKLDFSFQLAKGDVRLGDKEDTVTVDLDLELSKVNLWVPKEALVYLEKHLSLSGFSDSNVRVVRGKNYDSNISGKPVIFIKYEGALSKLNLKGY
jgi:hypothetical protein